MWMGKRKDFDDGGYWDKCATFKVRKNKFIDGYNAYESTVKGTKGFFIRHENFRMKIQENDGSELFHYDASFKKKKKKTGTGSEGSCSSSQAGVSFDHSDWGNLFLYAGDDGYCSGGYDFDLSDFVSDWPEYDSELECQYELDLYEEVEEAYDEDAEQEEYGYGCEVMEELPSEYDAEVEGEPMEPVENEEEVVPEEEPPAEEEPPVEDYGVEAVEAPADEEPPA